MLNKKIVSLIAGGAGFIGVNLANQLKELGHKVVIGDNFSLGSNNNINKYVDSGFNNFINTDVSSERGVTDLFEFAIKQHGQIDQVWHLAANSDIPSGIEDSQIDLKDTFMTTYHLLEGCKSFGVKRFNFASSSAVYGDWKELALVETMGPLTPISNYGAMKLASEAIICSAKDSFLKSVNIFRFPNVVGVPATHGVILDFIKKLHKDANCLNVLGNGSQRKSYLHVSELVSAMIYVSEFYKDENNLEILNIGCDDDGILVSEIAKIVVSMCAPKAKIFYGDKNRGWIGDVPKFSYDVSKLKNLGWKPKYSSREAVIKAVKEIYTTFLDEKNA